MHCPNLRGADQNGKKEPLVNNTTKAFYSPKLYPILIMIVCVCVTENIYIKVKSIRMVLHSIQSHYAIL